MRKFFVIIFLIFNLGYIDASCININTNERISELLTKASELEKKAEYENALKVYDEALKIASEEKLVEDASFIYNKIGLIYFNQKKFNVAALHFRKSIKKDSVSEYAANSYYCLSLIHRKQKNQDSLFFYLNKSIVVYNKLEASDKKYGIYSKAGILYKNAGSYNDAMKYLLLAYEGFDSLNNQKKKASVCNTIATTQRLLGNLDIAEKYYYKALEINKVLKDTLQISYSYVKVANLLKERKQYDSAITNYKKGIALQKNLKIRKEIGKMLNNLASVYYLINDFRKAEKTYQQALVFKKKEHDTLAMGYTYNELALLEIHNNDVKNSKKYLDSASTYISVINNKDVVLRNYEVQSIYYKSINDYKKALEYKEKYSELYEIIFNEKQSKLVQELQEKFESKQKQEKISELSESNTSKGKIIDTQKEDLQQKNLYLLILGLSVLLILGAYLYLKQGQRNKVRKLEYQRFKAVFKGQEIIKENISKDLHDIISTNYDGIRLKILALPKAKTPSKVSLDIVSEIKEINHQIRLISHRLSPLGDKVKDASLRDIIVAQLSEFQFYRKIFIDLQLPLPNELDDFKLDAQTNFYGILLETLNNIEKHSQATKVIITHSKDSIGNLEFNVFDNGIGYNNKNSRGIGLLNMKQRALLLGGECIIESSNIGTKVSVKFPIKPNML